MNDPLGIGEQGLIPMMSSAVSGDASEREAVNQAYEKGWNDGFDIAESRHERGAQQAKEADEESRAIASQAEAVSGDASELEDVLRRNGFVRCDIAACNCGSWHARYGLPERMSELKDMLAEAGHPLCNENGNLIGKALRSLINERDALASKASLAKRGTEPSDEADPLQGAADWFKDAIVDCNVADIQYRLLIGYNRAKRLFGEQK